MNYIGNDPAPAGVILLGDTNPIGSIAFFHSPTGGWLQLNGQTVSKTAYPDLWAYAQGFLTADQVANPGLYKSIDASNFAVPKLDGLFIRSLGGAAAALGVKQDFGAVGTAYSNVALVPCVKALKAILMPATSLPSFASQADVELASDSTKIVTASVMKYHPGMAKAWVVFNGTGGAVVKTSYNVTSVVRNGLGDYSVTFTVPFSSADYASLVTIDGAGAVVGYTSASFAPTASVLRLQVRVAGSGGAADSGLTSVACFGDQ